LAARCVTFLLVTLQALTACKTPFTAPRRDLAMKSSRKSAPDGTERDQLDEHFDCDETHFTTDEPDEEEPDDASELDEVDQFDEASWEAFVADDDECDPLPDYGDFWIEDE
jgi:hypothetical protein